MKCTAYTTCDVVSFQSLAEQTVVSAMFSCLSLEFCFHCSIKKQDFCKTRVHINAQIPSSILLSHWRRTHLPCPRERFPYAVLVWSSTQPEKLWTESMPEPVEITAPITTKLSGNQRIFGIVILQSALLYRAKQVSTASAAQDSTMKGKWYLLSQEVMSY